jgi:uncharacterized protein
MNALLGSTYWMLNRLPSIDFLEHFFHVVVMVLPVFVAAAAVGAVIRVYLGDILSSRIIRSRLLSYPVILFISIVLPFCSAGTSTIVVTLIELGFPVQIAIAFLICTPLVDPLALVLLTRLFGPLIAIEYVALGVIVAVVLAELLGRFWTSRALLARFSREASSPAPRPSPREVLIQVGRFLRQFSIAVTIGVLIGSVIYGFVPTTWLTPLTALSPLYAVPIAVALGAPLYTTTDTMIPVVYALYLKGMNPGVGLAFLMSATTLGIPELIILARAVQRRFVVQYASSMLASFVVVGLVLAVGR